MSEQIGWRGLRNQLKREAPAWVSLLPALPRLAHQALSMDHHAKVRTELAELRTQVIQTRWLLFISTLLTLLLGGLVAVLVTRLR